MSTTNRETGAEHATGTREEWVLARKELLEREKQLTRQSDELARQRRALPWVAIDKVYEFETNEGTKTLSDLFGFSAFNEEDRANGTGFNFGTPTCYDRGTDGLHLGWQLLDRAPKGRDEGACKDWPRKHDEYGAAQNTNMSAVTHDPREEVLNYRKGATR